MNRLKAKMFAVVLMSLALLFGPGLANAQATEVTSAPASTVSLSMSVSESITVSGTPASITFTYSPAAGGTATASGPITVNVSWSLAAGHAAGVIVQSWLSSATAALGGPASIPSSQVFQAVNGGAATACTGTADPASGIGVAGAACSVVASSPSPVPAGTGNRSSTVVLSLSGLGALTPGVYTGTWNVEGYVL
jgi:hypothetical protein